MSEHKHTNALIHASSPYLLQHAHNPVNWQEWSEDISVQARREDKLILISIGYSSCHWCHVMEHECFEKEDTAAIMNKNFICVKLDREERPDIDQVYIDAIQLLTGRGGWPLNVFTLPDGRPLHGGTYFPKQEWERVLLSLSNFYQDKREEAFEFATNLSNGIKNLDKFGSDNKEENLFPIVLGLLDKWKTQFDLKWGAYNWSPKFPLPNQWELFMGINRITKDPIFEEASWITLTKMAKGGIMDQLAGGFARYSTDGFWKVPHFEKMLYDNAQLMGTYAMAASYFKEEKFKKVVAEIDRFIQTEMQTAEGGFYSALDADTEGVEGKFYVWGATELEDILEDKAPIFFDYFSITQEGNWEHGINILHQEREQEDIAANYGISVEALEELIGTCKKLLLLERSKRIAPGLDDKIICSWNALMIKGYAQAAIYLQNQAYLEQATKAMDFLLSWSLEGNKLYRIHKNGKTSIDAFAEDYACLIEALIYLFEAGADEKYLVLANQLMNHCMENFQDEKSGLFYFSSKAQSVLVTRKIDVNDDVIPSSNSILAKCLYKLSYYFENENYQNLYQNMLQSIKEKMSKFPNGYSNWMQLVSWIENGFIQLVISGEEAQKWKQEISKTFQFNTVVLVTNGQSKIPLLQEKLKPENGTIAWVCTDKTCGLPRTELNLILQNLVQTERI
ncbi:MAG: thioredoxin domain-containing protein [Bacteroidia bacterium]|nr:thioredoxin domain-containing protein [Bacteroidia bacterium]MCF8425706.1 thioredoxin domain-containing protein [Bacteroidia bacterium]MCF8446784.1 thioredoxin domain-containing protein [Bacteroidia bacterium]